VPQGNQSYEAGGRREDGVLEELYRRAAGGDFSEPNIAAGSALISPLVAPQAAAGRRSRFIIFAQARR
jgi:hypothetical protein